MSSLDVSATWSTSWLTAGDPGPRPGPALEPPCCAGWCGCFPGAAAALTAGAAAFLPVSAVPVPAVPVLDVSAWAVPGVPRPAPGAAPLLAELTGCVDALAAHGALSGSRADTAALLVLAERARGLALRELAEMDTVGGHLVAGQVSTTASWLRGQQTLSVTAARSAVRLARELREDLPGLADLVQAGGTTVEHAAAVLGGVRGLDRTIVRDAAAGLCALAQATDPVDARRRLRDKAHAIDDRLGAESERKARQRMGLRLAEVGGHTALDGTLAGEDGATVRLAMALGVEAGRIDGDRRSIPSRQAEILVGWASTALAAQHGAGDSLDQDAHTIRTHLLITCTPEQLTAPGSTPQPAGLADPAPAGLADPAPAEPCGRAGCPSTAGLPAPGLAELVQADLAGAGPVSPMVVGGLSPLSRGALRRLACDATIDLVVRRSTAGRGPAGERLGDPLYVGRSSRTVSGRQFKALVVRDRTCVVDGCHRPPAQCAAHHVLHWADGGTSDLDNLVLLCHQHHHDHHDRGQALPHQDRQRWLTHTGWAKAP